MAISPYIERLRRLVGTERLLLPSITVVIRDDEGRVLLVRERSSGQWGTVGGLVEIGEHPAEAAVREAKEEAGVDVALTGILTAVGGPRYEVVYPNGDRTAYVAVVYGASVVAGEPVHDGDETTGAGWFTLDEVASLDLNSFARALFDEIGLLPRA